MDERMTTTPRQSTKHTCPFLFQLPLVERDKVKPFIFEMRKTQTLFRNLLRNLFVIIQECSMWNGDKVQKKENIGLVNVFQPLYVNYI